MKWLHHVRFSSVIDKDLSSNEYIEKSRCKILEAHRIINTHTHLALTRVLYAFD